VHFRQDNPDVIGGLPDTVRAVPVRWRARLLSVWLHCFDGLGSGRRVSQGRQIYVEDLGSLGMAYLQYRNDMDESEAIP
jgi:hypothetical protein